MNLQKFIDGQLLEVKKEEKEKKDKTCPKSKKAKAKNKGPRHDPTEPWGGNENTPFLQMMRDRM
jgi:hypothetical protein